MIYTDTALSELRNVLTSLGLGSTVVTLTEEDVELSVEKSEFNLTVWFSASKQRYGFNMIQGGMKTYATIEEFEEFFKIYLEVYTELIPRTKVISDIFEEFLGINTVYDSFFGNSDEGFTAVFKVLNDTSSLVHISEKETNLFNVKFLSNESGDSMRVVYDYLYRLNKDNSVQLVPNISYYINTLYKKYEDDETINISRYEVDAFIFDTNELKLDVKVLFENDTISYELKQINGVDYNRIVNNIDVFNLDVLFIIANDLIKKSVSKKTPKEKVEIQEEVSVEEVVSSEVNGVAIESVETLLNAGNAIEEAHAEKGFENNMDVSIKLVVQEGNVVAVRFSTEKGIFDVNMTTVKDLGLPVNYIPEKVERYLHKGIYITDEERSKKCFAKDVSDNKEVCSTLLDSLFD